VANKGQENLIPFTERTEEEQRDIARQGGIASGIARREKATMKATLEMLLGETNKKSGKTYRELATLGLIKGAINGNATNYRTMLELLGELKTLEGNKEEQELSKLDKLLEEMKKNANS
jgi:hypothetical protein